MSHLAKRTTSGSASVAGDKGIEGNSSKTKLASMPLSKREAAAPSTCRHSYSTDEACQGASCNGTGTVSRISKMKIFEERARKMDERYGLVIEASDLVNMAPSETVYRVDKPIRVRVRRVCHKCNTIFAVKNECPQCRHARCDKCPRYPSKESEADLLISLEEMEAVVNAKCENPAILADFFWGDQQIELKRPSKTGGQDLVHRRPRQRVRRTCHECETLFAPGSRKCECCRHVRCTDCPRDPFVFTPLFIFLFSLLFLLLHEFPSLTACS